VTHTLFSRARACPRPVRPIRRINERAQCPKTSTAKPINRSSDSCRPTKQLAVSLRRFRREHVLRSLLFRGHFRMPMPRSRNRAVSFLPLFLRVVSNSPESTAPSARRCQPADSQMFHITTTTAYLFGSNPTARVMPRTV